MSGPDGREVQQHVNSVAITGVSGYIGGRLLACLDGLPEVGRVTGIDIRPPAVTPAKLRFYCRDIRQPLGDIFIENEVDCAVHLAFVLRPARNAADARQVDVSGLSNFLVACRQAGVRHILYLSSHTVYGAYPDNLVPVKEEAALRPASGFQYSADKVEAERVLADFAAEHGEVCVTILRCCPVIGPHAGASVVAAMFRPVMPRVAGFDPPLQFVHEDDLTGLMVAMLKRRQEGVFNVAGDGEVRYSEVARLCRSRMVALPDRLLRWLMAFSWALRLQDESPPGGLEFIKYPPLLDTGRLKKETGFRLRYSSQEALEVFIAGCYRKGLTQRR